MFGNYGFYQQPQYFQQPQQQSGDDRIWVQGEGAAKAYLIAPGATVTLWDTEQARIYVKSVAANGMPNIQCLNYTINAPAQTNQSDFEARLSKVEEWIKSMSKEATDNV